MGMWCHILFICCLLCWYFVYVLYFHLFGVLFSFDCLYMSLLRVNDDSNRGYGSESGFGGSDNVEGAFGGEQDIPHRLIFDFALETKISPANSSALYKMGWNILGDSDIIQPRHWVNLSYIFISSVIKGQLKNDKREMG
ncbi:hypothetical protein Hanom_Chr09g00771051 [Helianthus anomalus]